MAAVTTMAHLDVSAGVAGDMCLGALVDAGLPLSALEEVVEALGLSREVRLVARQVHRGPVMATKVDVWTPHAPPAPEAAGPHVHAHESESPNSHGSELQASDRHGAHAHDHRTLREVLALVRGARGLPPEALADAVRTFTLLADAEGRVHGIPPEEVHFHEVGALDALVDVVGTCVGLRRLGVLDVRTSALPWSSGTVQAAHGVLPLPAPATLHLLVGMPTFPSGETFEQVTPTGAALVRALSRGIGTPPGFVPRVVGLGAGNQSGGRLPNVVRLVLGETGGDATPTDVIELATNLDDATGQQVGHAIERVLAVGALDAWATPATMKKSRPGIVLSVLVEAALADAVEAVLLRETPTLGLRRHRVARTVLPRRVVAVPTSFGPIHVKVRTTPSGDEATPEYDDCRLAAERVGVSWREVAAATLRSWEKSTRAFLTAPLLVAATLLSLAGCGDDGKATLSPPKARPPELPAPRLGVAIDERLGLSPPWVFSPPPTWREVDGGSAPGRIVTYRIGAGEGPEVALSTAGGSVVANVDRWRGQVGLEPAGEPGVAALPRKPFVGREGIYVDLRGTGNEPTRLFAMLMPLPATNLALKLMGPASMVDGEEARFLAFAASLQSRLLPPQSVTPPTEAPPSDPPPSVAPPAGSTETSAEREVVVEGNYRVRIPRGWTQGPAKPLRSATFYVGGRKDLELTFHDYDATPNGVLLNINRWRGQMGLPEATAEDVDRLPRVPMLGGQAVVLDLEGRVSDSMRGVEQDGAGMLAIVLDRGDRMLFLKLIGPRADVVAARRDVEALCRSMEAVR